MVTDDSLYDWKAFYKVKIVFIHPLWMAVASKIYLLKNAKKTCKWNSQDLNRDWIKVTWTIKQILVCSKEKAQKQLEGLIKIRSSPLKVLC